MKQMEDIKDRIVRETRDEITKGKLVFIQDIDQFVLERYEMLVDSVDPIERNNYNDQEFVMSIQDLLRVGILLSRL